MSRAVLVTGANRGIGLEFTRQYLKEGCSVVATCRNPEDAQDLRALDEVGTGELLVERLDITSDDQVRSVVETVGENFGGLDLLINNAGFTGTIRVSRTWSRVTFARPST